MDTKDIISIHRFCSLYNVPATFVNELDDFELIELIDLENEKYIRKSNLKDLERIIHLRFDLNINPEGIDVIHHLLQRISQMQEEINELRNRLALYE
ncbi:MAG: chaperone modulator CbpM [Bacteroidales bacterium]|nr:chaperone modulator CbpM [Bacteroidales bacterium]